MTYVHGFVLCSFSVIIIAVLVDSYNKLIHNSEIAALANYFKGTGEVTLIVMNKAIGTQPWPHYLLTQTKLKWEIQTMNMCTFLMMYYVRKKFKCLSSNKYLQTKTVVID